MGRGLKHQNRTLNRVVLILIGVTTPLMLFFQQCSDVSFRNTEDLNSANNVTVVPKYEEARAGDAANFPPLKLVFVVDNSGTMGINQINLSTAFEKMFAGDNATNLAPFDTTAYVINTAQASVDRRDAVFPLLPNRSLASFADVPFNQFLQDFRGTTLSGQVPGDLVGFGVRVSEQGGLARVEYHPAPVAGFKDDNGRAMAEIGVRKKRGESVEGFTDEFKKRISILAPERSAFDAATGRGILDPVVDRESGLCALGRTLRRNEGILNPGDVAAFIMVSDENDQDPAGRSCVDTFQDYNGNEELVDGECVRDRTTVSHLVTISNPICRVNYNAGFRYRLDFNVPRVSVSYARNQHRYERLTTLVTYHTVQHRWQEALTDVDYFTKAPTYQIPRTTIRFFRRVETCQMRDGVKVNCVYSYPAEMITVNGDGVNSCAAFIVGKLPADAVTNNQNYPYQCVAAQPLDRSGPCSSSDPNVINCRQNYSAPIRVRLAGRPQADNCAAFVQERLPAGAVVNDAGYEPRCLETKLEARGPANGVCPASDPVKLNCENVYTRQAPTTALANRPSGTCAAFVRASFPAAVLEPAEYAPTCANGPNQAVEGVGSLTPNQIANPNIVNYSAFQARVPSPRVVDGVVGPSETCLDFVRRIGPNSIDANVVLEGSGPNALACATATNRRATREADVSYANLAFSYDPRPNDACSQEFINRVATSGQLVASVNSCVILRYVQATQTYANMTCDQVDGPGLCAGSNERLRGCVEQETPAGEETRMFTRDGSFTCDTPCSEVGFCNGGVVRDHYRACATAAAAPVVRTVAGQLKDNPAICMNGEKFVLRRGPYREVGTRPTYVAGSRSENGEMDALAQYIKERSEEIFKANTPALSVFVRQPGDALGENGSLGESYNALAELMGGRKESVLTNADGYAQALQYLSGVIRNNLDRSFTIRGFTSGQQVRQVWMRKKGASEWGEALDPSLWSASGGTVTLSQDLSFTFGDEFRFEYY